jgi:UDP:flavonoid glycosyltransferase YjiC (YdhE family)
MQIAFYVSGHGLGHASRDIELMKALAALRPQIRFVVRTSAPRWLFDQVRGVSWTIQALDTDPGIVQIDSLRLDEEETARRAARFYADFDEKVSAEAGALEELGTDVVIGDIPPLAMAAADCAGIPGVAVGNFTWDWIYSVYPAFDRVAPEAIATIARGYSHAACALRLPLHGGFESMHAVTRDIPFIARRSHRDPAETRRILGVPGDRPVVLASFGGYGVDLPLDRIRETGRFTLLETVRDPPAGLSYQDLVAAADVVVSKPGYGIVSECVANDTALLYTSRGRFIEYDLFVAEMPRVLRCRYLSQEDLFAGRWADAVDALLGQPAPPERPAVNGAEIAADHIIKLESSC